MKGLLCFDDICIHEHQDHSILNKVQNDPIISELSKLVYGVSNANADVEETLDYERLEIYYSAFEQEMTRVTNEYICKYNNRLCEIKLWLDNKVHVSIENGKAYIESEEFIEPGYATEIQNIVNTYVDSIVQYTENFDVHEYSEEICVIVIDVMRYDRPITIIYPDELNE